MPATQERITSLEVQVKHLTALLDKHVVNTEEKHGSIDEKLTELLELKHKGMGAFWLASALIGAGIITVVLPFFDWIRRSVFHG